MNLKAKIFLLAIVPFLLAIVGIGIGVRHQATALARAQHATTQAAYLASKEIELRHYVDLAMSAIAPLYEAAGENARDDAMLRSRALATLEKLDFGQDGYFFVYDMHGRSLMHPREPDLVGRDLWTLRDPAGSLTIQQLIAAASRGGGYVRYVWHRPSTGKLAPKLGYVVPLERWNWMVGTGIYLDDVDTTLAHIDQRASSNIERTMMWIGGIALAGLAVITLCALVLNVSEYRSADAKLRRLAQQVVASQENERARLSRELHDGISQMMVSVKLLLESALARFEHSDARLPAAEAALSTGLARLGDTLREVRRISHALRPSMLDDLGLAAALEQLTRELGAESGVAIAFAQTGQAHGMLLPDAMNTALFRIAQEALTNIVGHAHASEAALALDISEHTVVLTIEDNGRGFDIDRVQADPNAGVGLRNMRERLEALGGALSLVSQPGRSVVRATVPVPAHGNNKASAYASADDASPTGTRIAQENRP
ncbi:cache domain-containing protein [Paraburkholderia sp. SOS3]|jgi:two-component system NarL family sensor kinase|uniref:cache domain-containing protein n=1 Tax=Paraburkholderia sp. SOS3 TaxID=1926494 RepID=UPI0009475A7A|nr:cache domain-containing protein [Paraburkholderia sp. SOS3]APR38258.1 histidine kinase [Paraburkholderia sp. SOS3]